MRNFDAYEDTKVQRNVSHVITYFIFLNDVAADNKGRGWGREKYCEQYIKILN